MHVLLNNVRLRYYQKYGQRMRPGPNECVHRVGMAGNESWYDMGIVQFGNETSGMNGNEGQREGVWHDRKEVWSGMGLERGLRHESMIWESGYREGVWHDREEV